MKLGFSTLGVPGMPLAQVRDLALRSGWTGIEVISSADEPVHTGLGAGARRAARDTLGADVTLLSVNSYVRVGRSDRSDEQVVDDLLAEARLAADLGAPAVRVFPGADHEGDDRRIVTRLRTAARLLPPGTGIWLETHDSHATGAAVARLLDAVADPRVRVVWDIAHPHDRGERWSRTYDLLHPHLAHVQIKDEGGSGGRAPVLLGEGSLPVARLLGHLLSHGYRQWISLEWERKWHPGAANLEVALSEGRAWLEATLPTT